MTTLPSHGYITYIELVSPAPKYSGLRSCYWLTLPGFGVSTLVHMTTAKESS